ncbi:MAG: hypothetical protein ACYDAY_11485 [Candidatus Dormibacteria bacterium]
MDLTKDAVRVAVDRQDLRTELFKAVRGAGDPEANLYPDTRPAAELVAEAEEAWKAARSASTDDISKGVAPQLQGLIAAQRGNDDLRSQLADLQKTVAELTKTEFTGTYPISGSQTGYGFAVYDLEAPSKKIFPVLTPFRNRVPRTDGEGSAVHWKQITSISGSGGAQPVVNHFLAELPSNSVGGLTLNLPPEIQWGAADKNTSYVPIGLSGSNSMISQIASRGYEDIRSLVGLSVLQSLMLSEERGLWSGRTTAVSAPTISSATAGAASGSQTAITGASGSTVYVKVTALTMMGESVASAATTVASVTNGTSVVTVTIGTVTGAEGYRVYVSTGASDPGDASRWKAGECASNVFVIQGALPTSGATPPASDSTASANAYLGVFPQLEGGANFYNQVLNATLTLANLQTAFQDRFDNLKADPEEMWTSASDRRSFSDLVLAQSGAAAQGFRINITPGADGITAGVIVSAVLNESTGREVPLRVHPWLHQGNLVGLSYTLPFPNSEVPNVWEVKGPQDYLAIDWPVIDMNYRTSVIAFNALIGYAPDFNFWIKGIKNANPTLTNQ